MKNCSQCSKFSKDENILLSCSDGIFNKLCAIYFEENHKEITKDCNELSGK